MLERLVGKRLPNVGLVSTEGRTVYPAMEPGVSVFFCYPYTGRPDYPDPPGWDGILGAHGSTPQALGFSKAYELFQKQGVKVYGVSFQDTFWQSEFVSRHALRIPLLSDHSRKFSNALQLETFRAGEEDYLERLTFLALDGTIICVRFPIKAPELDAAETLLLVEALAAT